MTVGVTGANGFIGREVATTLRVRGHEVHSLVRDVNAVLQPARHLDLARRPLPPGTCDGLEAVVHCAAYLPTSYTDVEEAQRCFDINALGTLVLLQECVRARVRQFVHLSGNLYRVTPAAATEDAPFEPSAHASNYLVSKAAADFIASHFRGALRVAILRVSNVYGPTLQRGMIATFVTRLLAGEPISVEDGNYQADPIHVADVASVVATAVEQGAEGPYNVGSGAAVRPLEIAQLILTELAAPRVLLQTKPAASSEVRGFCALDITRARTELGFAPSSLVDGLRAVIAEMRARR
jgi:UDP-glucose 4-epimerase